MNPSAVASDQNINSNYYLKYPDETAVNTGQLLQIVYD